MTNSNSGIVIDRTDLQLPFSERENKTIDFIIIHCCGYSLDKAVASFKENDVSAHYIIDDRGCILQLVPDEKCAWHAGKSSWHDVNGLNQRSIGIEMCSPSLGQNNYPDEQISALMKLLAILCKKYKIPAQNILGHSDVAPTRKPDPGKAFPWKKLAQHNFGSWYDIHNAPKVTTENLQKCLQIIGYDTSDMSAALCAFCRHFYPTKIYKSKDIFKVLDSPVQKNIVLDSRLTNRIRAVAYAYEHASKKPCKM